MTTMVAIRGGSYDHWKQEAAIKEFRDLLFFLHHQAIIDQSFYKIEIDLEKNAYRVGLLKPESQVNESINAISNAGVGTLTLELNDFMNPILGDEQTLIPPPSYPSLFEPVKLPDTLTFEAIKTNRAEWFREDGEIADILISPKGYSEFAVIKFARRNQNDDENSNGQIVSFLINPYTGYVDSYANERDFEWVGRN